MTFKSPLVSGRENTAFKGHFIFTKRETGNMYSMHVFFKVSIFPLLSHLLNCLTTQCLMNRCRGILCKRHGQGEGGG